MPPHHPKLHVAAPESFFAATPKSLPAIEIDRFWGRISAPMELVAFGSGVAVRCLATVIGDMVKISGRHTNRGWASRPLIGVRRLRAADSRSTPPGDDP